MSLRILHCPTNVAGIPYQIARAERSLGLDSWAVSIVDSQYKFPCDEILIDDPNNYVLRELARWRLFFRALLRADVVHFNFGQTTMPTANPWTKRPGRGFLQQLNSAYKGFLELRDLRLLRKCGKTVIVSYYGDDIRDGAYARSHFPDGVSQDWIGAYYTPESDEWKVRCAQRVKHESDAIIAFSPDLLFSLPERAVFIPCPAVDLSRIKPAPATGAGPIRIVHAPTNKDIKGTEFVLAAVDRLRSEGRSFEFSLIEGLEHQQAMDVYRKADVVVDQLIIGWYGVFAIELMAMAKTIVCFMHPDNLARVSPAMQMSNPIISATPHTIYHALSDIISRTREELAETGQAGRDYVETWHDPKKIAVQLKDLYSRLRF